MTRPKPVPVLSLLLAATLALGACGRSGGAASASPSGGRPASPALRVRLAPVQVQDVVASVKALGTLEAEDLVQVTAEVEGAVAEVAFNEGDRVSPETVLARIDPERYRLEAQRAQAALAKAEADAERARQELERREKLFVEQLVAQEELNRARSERDRLAGEAAAARAARDIADQNVRRSEVRPSRGGVIDTRTVEHGPVRARRDRAGHAGRRQPPAPALQGLGGRVPAGPARPDRGLPRGGAGRARLPGPHLPRGRAGQRHHAPGRGAGLGPEPRPPEARLLRRGGAQHRDPQGRPDGARERRAGLREGLRGLRGGGRHGPPEDAAARPAHGGRSGRDRLGPGPRADRGGGGLRPPGRRGQGAGRRRRGAPSAAGAAGPGR